ncbi:hypothetical protein CBS115989_8916 [Aspergillus niger]|nr:hypothetical protein CBS115989_8916 [Aspergillus niger]KAI2824716.1 hypothetical protein CBS133816_8766 [Aspergillus niger]KAI2835697.1 hypothetical protein CBS11350_9898 [Aspergillus niger]KAI2841395.1 hypothetical protein CBS11232_8825 [Aspergillus niger]KAI2874726.1 hypothetical protein CBS115988_5927 [Aspergillus niger]
MKAIIAFAGGDREEPGLLRYPRASSERPGGDIVRPLLDDFWVAGPDGRHRCLVAPPARMSLFDAKESSEIGLFQPKVAQLIIAQFICGVAFLHSKNIVHGDIHLENILVEFPKAIDTLPDTEHMHNEIIRNTWDVRFNYSIQEPRAEAGFETMTVQGKSAFEEIMWPVLKSEPEERATAEPLMQSEWMKGWGLPALEQSLKITRPEVEDKEGGS